jgi:hypothetical protein
VIPSTAGNATQRDIFQSPIHTSSAVSFDGPCCLTGIVIFSSPEKLCLGIKSDGTSGAEYHLGSCDLAVVVKINPASGGRPSLQYSEEGVALGYVPWKAKRVNKTVSFCCNGASIKNYRRAISFLRWRECCCEGPSVFC